jgi:hypothetical protein
MRALRTAVVAAAAALALAGCGASESSQVHAKVEQFFHAVSAHDAKTLCGQVLSSSLAGRFVGEGLSCERGVGIFFESVQSPTLSVGRITLDRNNASALVLTGAHCQRLALAQLFLVKTSNGWRINSESKEQPGHRTC